MIKSITVAFVYLLTIQILPIVLSSISSLIVTVYFLTMLKINAVNPHYNGSWRLYFKSFLKKLKK
jgi:hypothetical protein